MISRLDALDRGTDLLDDASALMPENPGEWKRDIPGLHREVRVAQAGGDHADDHLVAPRFVELDLLEGERRTSLVHYGGDGRGLHRASSL